MYPTLNAGTSKASQAFWQVNDVEAEVAELKTRGVKFEEHDMPGVTMKNSIMTGGGAKTAWFKDTEGIFWRSANAYEWTAVLVFKSDSFGCTQKNEGIQ